MGKKPLKNPREPDYLVPPPEKESQAENNSWGYTETESVRNLKLSELFPVDAEFIG